MDALGYYIFNSTRGQWLQDDRKSWGAFEGVEEFPDHQIAKEVREQLSGDDITYVMAALH